MGIKLEYLLPILLILVGVQIGATYLTIPLLPTGVTAFGDPQSIENPFIYLGYVILITAIFLLLFKIGFRRFITWFFLITVWSMMFFVLSLIGLQVWGNTNPFADILVFLLSVISVFFVWKYPEWYIIDIIGFIACIGVTTLIGVSFGIVPIIILLLIFAIYDAIAVYKTRHMITLAESVLTSKLPALFIIPKDRNFSYIPSKTWENLDDREARDAYIIGMGDIIFPSSLVVSANIFITGTRLFGQFTIPAIGAMVGSWFGLAVLQWYATKHPQSHAGLPFLNLFTIAGFGITYVVSYGLGI